MRSKTIKIELFKVRDKITMKQIAKDAGVSGAMVSMVVQRERRSRHIMERIAQAIDQPVEIVWPELRKANG
jgi:lambda repressor-like predicted transcriptional regulator